MEVRGRLSFDLHAGEILGLAGLVGAGRTSVLTRTVRRPPGPPRQPAGQDPRQVRVGRRVAIDAIRAGLALVPEERASQGLILDMLVERNIALPNLSNASCSRTKTPSRRPFMDLFGIRGGGAARRCCRAAISRRSCSPKWMARSPTVLMLDEPTRGLDIKAKRDVHDVVRKLASEGKGILVSSSEADEVAALCHRALVLSRGSIAGRAVAGPELTDANILKLAA